MVNILIADDDDALRQLIERTLRGDGHTVTAVGDGAAALAHVEAGDRPEILIADVDMPALNGIALAERALQLVPGLRVLMISGMPERLDAAKSINGAQALVTLQKPFTLEALRAEVSALSAG